MGDVFTAHRSGPHRCRHRRDLRPHRAFGQTHSGAWRSLAQDPRSLSTRRDRRRDGALSHHGLQGATEGLAGAICRSRTIRAARLPTEAMAVRRPVHLHQVGAVRHRGLSRPGRLGLVRRGQLFRRCRSVLAKAERSNCRQTRRLSGSRLVRGGRAGTGAAFPLMGPRKDAEEKGQARS